MVTFKRLDLETGQGTSEFLTEIMMLSRYRHENLITLLGYCEESDEKILVYEHAQKGSLDGYLSSTTLTWTKRISICLDAARGLSYLHDPRSTQLRVIHRNIRSSTIFLDDNWNAKISDFALSKFGPANQQYTEVITNAAGSIGYIDPIYLETGSLKKESDVYSFGVVLLEVLCGRLVIEDIKSMRPNLVKTWKKSYKHKKLDQIIFQDLLQPMAPASMEAFSDIAYQCLMKSRNERPSMCVVVRKLEIALQLQDPHYVIPHYEEAHEAEDTHEAAVAPVIRPQFEEAREAAVAPVNDYRSVDKQQKVFTEGKIESSKKDFQHLIIKLEEIKRVTNSFGNKVIGAGGFGNVYEGTLAHYKGQSKVAIKRLDRRFGQGDPEFLKEIMMLACYMHPNIISLLGFCDEDGEKILVYEHASNGSLDRHLANNALTWVQRIQICIDAAKGIHFLHEDKGTHQRVIHRDIKSSNILLDGNWNAKISDMGLSRIGPANQQYTFMYTNVVGTPGYCDPQYIKTFTLTKESDIYSFGVVLFEVLCGRLCVYRRNDQVENVLPSWKQSYKANKLDKIIFQDLTQPMDPASLETFSNIAFECLHKHREQRPTSSHVVEQLTLALEFQKRASKFETSKRV